MSLTDRVIKKAFEGPDEFLWAIFAGRSGSGKSVAAASMPKPFQEDDYDLRANGIRNAIEQGWLDAEGIEFHKFDPFGGYQQIEKHYNLLYLQVKQRSFRLKSLDIGSMTSLIRLLDLTSLTAPTSQEHHLTLSGLTMTGPSDYKFESQATHKIFDFLRTFPCHVTVAAHIVDRYGHPPGAEKYSAQTIIGEKLTITSNLAENVLAMFNDVYRFSKEIKNGKEVFYVEFSTDFAKNSFGIPPGKFNITRKPFYSFLIELINSIREGKSIKLETTGGFLQ